MTIHEIENTYKILALEKIQKHWVLILSSHKYLSPSRPKYIAWSFDGRHYVEPQRIQKNAFAVFKSVGKK